MTRPSAPLRALGRTQQRLTVVTRAALIVSACAICAPCGAQADLATPIKIPPDALTGIEVVAALGQAGVRVLGPGDKLSRPGHQLGGTTKSAREALDALAAACDLDWTLQNDLVVLRPRDSMAAVEQVPGVARGYSPDNVTFRFLEALSEEEVRKATTGAILPLNTLNPECRAILIEEIGGAAGGQAELGGNTFVSLSLIRMIRLYRDARYVAGAHMRSGLRSYGAYLLAPEAEGEAATLEIDSDLARAAQDYQWQVTRKAMEAETEEQP